MNWLGLKMGRADDFIRKGRFSPADLVERVKRPCWRRFAAQRYDGRAKENDATRAGSDRGPTADGFPGVKL